METVTTRGYEFNETLTRKIKYAYHDENTRPTVSLFGDMSDGTVQREWEVFNGEFMVGLRWALAAGDLYEADTAGLNLDAFKDVPLNVLFKGYPINSTLTMTLVMVRVSDDTVLGFGTDVTTGMSAYCCVDIKEKKLIAGTGTKYITDVFGPLYSENYLHYLAGEID